MSTKIKFSLSLFAALSLGLATLGCDKSNNSFCDATHACGSGHSCDLTTNECVASQDLGTPDLGVGDQGGGDGGGNGCAPACTGTTPICQAPTCVSCAQATDGEAACAAAAATTPHCLLTGADTGACVECRDDNDCGTATKRFCDATTHTCRGCIADSECTSLVCDETPGSATRGECIDKGQVVYVDVTGKCNAGNSGDFGSPICSVNSAQGLSGKSVIHLATGTYALENVVFNGDNWTLVGDNGATIQQINASKAAIEVKGGANLVVRNVTIVGTVTTSHGIDCHDNGSTVTVLQTTIKGNGGYGISSGPGTVLTADSCQILSNSLGGIVTTGAFDIRNSFIVLNGQMTGSSGGGVSIKSPATATTGFINNTVADNIGSGPGSGVACMNPVTLLDTILYKNQAGTTLAELTANCTTLYSATDDATDAARVGANNIDLSSQMPGFVGGANNDFHLTPTSPCKDKGTDSGTNDHDIDGQPRPDPTTMKVDIGADEVQ